MEVMIGALMSVYHADILDRFFKHLYQTETEVSLTHKLIIDSEEVKEALSEIDFELETDIVEIENPIIDELRKNLVMRKRIETEVISL